MTDSDVDEPVTAIVNSFTQLVPGDLHLPRFRQTVARAVELAGQGQEVENR
ncbi:hypothetical protein AAFN90_06180 [Erwiniaceae bacterium CAU 1747]